MLLKHDMVTIIGSDTGAFKNKRALVIEINEQEKKACLLVQNFEFSFTGQNMFFWFPFYDLKLLKRPKKQYFAHEFIG